MQEPLQLVRPWLQLALHTPALHTLGAAHAWPHAPQFAGSVAVSAHWLPQVVCGGVHMIPPELELLVELDVELLVELVEVLVEPPLELPEELPAELLVVVLLELVALAPPVPVVALPSVLLLLHADVIAPTKMASVPTPCIHRAVRSAWLFMSASRPGRRIGAGRAPRRQEYRGAQAKQAPKATPARRHSRSARESPGPGRHRKAARPGRELADAALSDATRTSARGRPVVAARLSPARWRGPRRSAAGPWAGRTSAPCSLGRRRVGCGHGKGDHRVRLAGASLPGGLRKEGRAHACSTRWRACTARHGEHPGRDVPNGLTGWAIPPSTWATPLASKRVTRWSSSAVRSIVPSSSHSALAPPRIAGRGPGSSGPGVAAPDARSAK